MEGNDLGGWYSKRQVVVLEPLLYQPPPQRKERLAAKVHGVLKRHDREAAQWVLNRRMCEWINYMGYQYSLPTEVWSFLPEEVFNHLQPPVDRICGDYVVEWRLWGSIGEAYSALRSNPHYVTVYDADEDRVDRYWHMRGTRVPVGSIPS